MEKNKLVIGIVFLAVGLSLTVASVLTDGGPLLSGLGGGLCGPGIVYVAQYIYWRRPVNRERYEKRREEEAILQQDELQTKIREEAGHTAFGVGLLMDSAAAIAIFVLGELGVLARYKLFFLCVVGWMLVKIAVFYAALAHFTHKYR